MSTSPCLAVHDGRNPPTVPPSTWPLFVPDFFSGAADTRHLTRLTRGVRATSGSRRQRRGHPCGEVKDEDDHQTCELIPDPRAGLTCLRHSALLFLLLPSPFFSLGLGGWGAPATRSARCVPSTKRTCRTLHRDMRLLGLASRTNGVHELTNPPPLCSQTSRHEKGQVISRSDSLRRGEKNSQRAVPF